VLFYRGRILDGLAHFTREQGYRTWTIKWVGEPRFFITCNPDNVKHILSDNFSNYPKGPDFNSTLADLLGSGIFAADGERWREQRRIAAHMFSDKEFRETIMASFIQHGAELDAILARHADSGEPVDVQNLFFRFTLDSIGKIAFGARVGSLVDPEVAFARAFDQAQATVDLRFFTPGWRLLKYVIPEERELVRSVRVMDDYCAELIRSRRAEGDYEQRRDVLSRWMSLKGGKDGTTPVHLHDDKLLRDTILNFLIAGRDTTAQALSWAVLMLAQNPEAEAALAAEVRAADPTGGDAEAGLAPPTAASSSSSSSTWDWAPSHDTVSRRLPVARAVMHETLRLYPSVPKDMKRALKSDTLPDGTFVPAGSNVVYVPYCMGRSAALWSTPEHPDPERFEPSRWLVPVSSGAGAGAGAAAAGDGAEPQTQPREAPGGGDAAKSEPTMTVRKESAFKFIAFNAGPRTCLGQNMALSEAVFVLGLVYRKFKLVPVPGQAVEYLDSLTLPMKNGLLCTVQRR
jgi:cytochrome P450